MKLRVLRFFVVFLASCLTACGTTAASYVDSMHGCAVTQGRIVKIENLSTQDLQPLADGLATIVGQPACQPGCRVTLRFDSERSKVFDVRQGVILVHGPEVDYVLEPHGSTNP